MMFRMDTKMALHGVCECVQGGRAGSGRESLAGEIDVLRKVVILVRRRGKLEVRSAFLRNRSKQLV